ncbi:hypothetical protein F5Y08DRAFT_297908, partial [Xylaria arbuscula]
MNGPGQGDCLLTLACSPLFRLQFIQCFSFLCSPQLDGNKPQSRIYSSHLIPRTIQSCVPTPDPIYSPRRHIYTMASTNYKEAFSLFDKRGNGRVTVDSLGDLLRACGQNPTLAEIRDLERSVGGEFDFETFSKILNRPGGFRDPGEPEDYCRGFQVFDKDMTGFIGVGQLKYILTNLGEKMTDEEVDELLKAVDTSSGQVNYTDLVRTILAN